MTTTDILEDTPSKESEVVTKDEFSVDSVGDAPAETKITVMDASSSKEYRLYRRRFVGITALVLLNIVSAMSWPWFGPISNNTAAEFGISLDQVNWLGNIVALVYLPTALLIPPFISRYGLRVCCQIGGVALILSAWIRYAGTAKSLSPTSAYVLLIIGQFFASIAQPIYQVIGPKYSETWFDLKGRTTATMIVAISNPFGGAVGQLISPLVGNTRQSILVLGILSTAVAPFVFLIERAPPTPPTYAGSKKSPSLRSLCLVMLGYDVEPAAYMSKRERIDFAIVVSLFAVLIAASNAFAILSAEILQPMGYSSNESGFMGACLLLSGMVAALVTAPLFDRVFTHHLAITSKCFVPIAALGWFVLIWAVRPHNTAVLFVIMTLIGVGSVPMLAVGLELACELTRNADGSAAIVWFAGNLFGVAFILIGGALRASANASPPLNMQKYLIFEGVIIAAVCSSVFFLHGVQKRKEADEEKIREAAALTSPTPP